MFRDLYLQKTPRTGVSLVEEQNLWLREQNIKHLHLEQKTVQFAGYMNVCKNLCKNLC